MPARFSFLIQGLVPSFLLSALLFACLSIPSPTDAAFVEQPQFGTGATLGLAWGDLDGDDDFDCAIANIVPGGELYRNNADGTFPFTVR